jgi:hypothetical protein
MIRPKLKYFFVSPPTAYTRHCLPTLIFGRDVDLELKMTTVDSDKVVYGDVHAITVAVLVLIGNVNLSSYLPNSNWHGSQEVK